jgi:hypothetical protein
VTTESGLRYKDITVGTGDAPKVGSTVRVHYAGWLDGMHGSAKFDSSYDQHRPLVFEVGTGQVIAGEAPRSMLQSVIANGALVLHLPHSALPPLCSRFSAVFP